jgi:methyl acetate hydrolase
MLLNGGELDGARVLKAETVTLMGQNNIGAVSVPALKTALPRSGRLQLYRGRVAINGVSAS